MKIYLAITKNKKSGIYLTSSEQMDKYLSDGWDIYEEENDERKLIATPESGFLVERPEYPVTTSNIRR